jgi:hypothetical protein
MYEIVPDSSSLTGANASVFITLGTAASPDYMASLLNVKIPFSLAFGGGGASYGGAGGKGYGENPIPAPYNDRHMTDLVAGSGGAMRDPYPFQVNAFLADVRGKGGHGGGAMEVTAANDIIVGKYGKIIMRGGNGEQTSQGGGGGGSGGGIVLAAGGVVVHQGFLDVSGGMGGFGGELHPELSGGGGGGGRIAIYGQSITITGVLKATGGTCGVQTVAIAEAATVVNATLIMEMITPLDNSRLGFLGETFVNDTVTTANVISEVVHRSYDNGTLQAVLLVSITLDHSSGYNMSNVNALDSHFAARLGGNGINYAEVLITNFSVINAHHDTIYPFRAIPSQCTNSGSDGSIFTETRMTTSMAVMETNGAENTNRAIFMSNRETTNTSSGSQREAPFSWNGPILPFEASQPARVTFYMRLSSVPDESAKRGYSALFTLLSRGVTGLNVSNVIGVSIGYQIMHGANFGSAVDEKYFLKRMVTIDPYPALDRWYKIDIKIKWELNLYSVSIDDTVVATNASFTGDDVDGIRLSVYRSVDVWFDEIYVGLDNTMSFTCPSTTRKGTVTDQPVQRGWSFEEVHGGNSNGYTEYYPMMRHYSHVDTTGSIPFDGQGDVKDNQDIKLQYATGDYPHTQGLLHAGALQYLTNSLRSGKSAKGASSTMVSPNGLWYQVPAGIGGAGDGRQFWYTEYNYVSPLSSTMNGGVAACSSQDLLDWRFEGIVFHYANISDMVFGSEGPFYVERPKVKWNPLTSSYVIWAVMDNVNRSLAMNAVLSSPYEDGPFYFRRSFYPDGNETRDQVIFVNDEQKPVLGRTYYQTVEFVLPQTIMQPTWEQVKNRDGSVNYSASYHRAVYDIGYDNYHDIYLQRWRKEDVEWNIVCVNKLTGVKRNVSETTTNSTNCEDPIEYKEVFGQGYPPIQTHFISPAEPEYHGGCRLLFQQSGPNHGPVTIVMVTAAFDSLTKITTRWIRTWTDFTRPRGLRAPILQTTRSTHHYRIN